MTRVFQPVSHVRRDAAGVDRPQGSCRRILRILPPWYRSNCISTQNRPRLCLPTQARISSPIRVPVAGWWRVIIPVGSPRYPMRMWVRPSCDLSVPGKHNTGKGPGRKRRVATGVSKKHSGLTARSVEHWQVRARESGSFKMTRAREWRGGFIGVDVDAADKRKGNIFRIRAMSNGDVKTLYPEFKMRIARQILANVRVERIQKKNQWISLDVFSFYVREYILIYNKT